MSFRNQAKNSLACASLLTGMALPAQALEDLGHYVFVPNRNSADIAVIDARTNTVATRIPVGLVPHQVAVSAGTMKMIASNTGDNTVSIVDLRTLDTVETLTLDHEPEHIELAPDGTIAAVGNIGAGTLSFVSLVENRELSRVDGLYEPHNMTFSPDGSLVYVGNLGADLVSVVDVASATVINEIPVGKPQTVATASPESAEFQGIINVTATPDGSLGFAAFGEGDAMAVLDLRTQETISTLATGNLPWRAYPTADGKFMIVPNNGDETVSIISVATLEEVARLKGAADMTGVNTGWFETTAFVISRGEQKLVVFDLDTMERVGEIDLPGVPETGVTTPDGTMLYVALSSSNQVAVIDVRRRALVTLIDNVGNDPWGAHMVGALNYCH